MGDTQPPEGKKPKGLFITFEGGEGVGKTTQIRLLADAFKAAGHRVTLSREPGGTAGAEAVRHVVLDKAAAQSFGPQMEALLFAAARSDHVEQVIRPALARGDVVIVDRFMDSTRVYQGASNNLDKGFVSALEKVAVHGTVPDMTIILDLDPAIGLKRAAQRRDPSTEVDRFERETVAMHAERREAFRSIAKAEPDRCRLVDASGSVDEIAAAIRTEVQPLAHARGFDISPVALPRKPKPDKLMGFKGEA